MEKMQEHGSKDKKARAPVHVHRPSALTGRAIYTPGEFSEAILFF
jgi:hypothetical protein